MLGVDTDVVLRNYDAFSARHKLSDLPSQTPFEIYMVKFSSALFSKLTVFLSGVLNLNKPDGGDQSVVPQQCSPRWEYQYVGDETATFTNGWSPINAMGGGWVALDNTNSNAQPVFPVDSLVFVDPRSTAQSQSQTPFAVNNAWTSIATNTVNNVGSILAPYATSTRWLLVRISAAKRALVTASGSAVLSSNCGSNNVKISKMSLDIVKVPGQCSSYKDCLTEADSNPNKGQKDDSANKDPARFSSCVVTQTIERNYLVQPTTKCVECTSDSHCGSGQYCHLDDGICDTSTIPFKYNCDPDSGKLFGMCRQKSPDVLGKTCRNIFAPSYASMNAAPSSNPLPSVMTDGQPVAAAIVSVPAAGRAPGQMGPGGINAGVTSEGDTSNDAFAKGANGVCGEFRFSLANDPAALDATRPSVVRAALWTGFCDSQRLCMECVPGAGGSGGSVCLNGQKLNSIDVDGTVRTFSHNTAAGSILGTTSMVILLILMWASYMFTEARRSRHSLGLSPMTYLECLFCCCGTWSEKFPPGKVLGSSTIDIKNPVV
jgi:Cys-rich repeat protein